MGRRTRHRWAALAVSVSMTAAACGGGGDDAAGVTVIVPTTSVPTVASTSPAAPETTTPATAAQQAVDAVGLAATSAAPFENVAVTGMSAEIEPTVEIVVHGAETDGPIPIFVDGDELYISVPPHPDDPMVGGIITVIVQRDGAAGDPIELDVAPLTPAPGAWDDLTAAVDAWLGDAAAGLGTTLDELRAAPREQLAPQAAVLLVADALLSDLELGDAAPEVVDAMVAGLALESVLAQPLDLTGFSPLAPEQPVEGFRRAISTCVDTPVTVRNAAELSEKIATGRDWLIREGSAEDEVLDGLATFLAGAGFAPGAGWAAGALGAFFAGIRLVKNAKSGGYPTEVGDLTVDIHHRDFVEDFTEPGDWSKVTVDAIATGWDGLPDIASLATAISGALVSAFNSLEVIGISNLQGFAVDAATFVKSLVTTKLATEFGVGVIGVCPKTWQDVDVTGEPWTQVRAVNDRFEVSAQNQLFQPRDGGDDAPFSDTLEFRLDANLFAGQGAQATYPVSVSAIEVEGPYELWVSRAGAPLPITVSSGEAWDQRLRWEAPYGGFPGEAVGQNAEGPAVTSWTNTHVTSSEPGDFPYDVKVSSASSTGLRADGQPPREHLVRVRLAPFRVEPPSAQLAVGESIVFQALDDQNREVTDVVWSATGGDVDPGPAGNTEYVAGPTAGQYTVTATRGDVSISAPVSISDDCFAGTWGVDMDRVAADLSADGQVTMTPLTGSITITLTEDLTFVANLVDWKVSMSAASVSFPIGAVGSVWGSFTIERDPVEPNKGRFATVTFEGQDINVTAGPISANADELPIGQVLASGEYECTADGLIIYRDDYDAWYYRID